MSDAVDALEFDFRTAARKSATEAKSAAQPATYSALKFLAGTGLLKASVSIHWS